MSIIDDVKNCCATVTFETVPAIFFLMQSRLFLVHQLLLQKSYSRQDALHSRSEIKYSG